MIRSLSSIAVIAAAVVVFAGAGSAVEEQILVRAQVIFATEGEMIEEAVPMDESDPLYNQLKKLFRFKNYGTLTTALTYVLPGERREASLALRQNMVLVVQPKIVGEKSIQLRIEWNERYRNKAGEMKYSDILSTTIVSADGATTLLGGKQETFVERGEEKRRVQKKGSLILAITPTIVRE